MKLFRGTFRLSLIVASLVAAFVGFQRYGHYVNALDDRESVVLALKCGAKIDPANLETVKNEYGLFDIGKLGCSDKQFWASKVEMQQAWNGNMGSDWADSAPSYDWVEVAVKFLIAFLLTNFAGFVLWVSQKLMSWVRRGYA